MELKLEKKEQKPLVERDEFVLKIKGTQATPSNAQVKEEVSKLLSKAIELVVVKKIHQKYGTDECIAFIYVYNNIDSLKKFETINKKSRKKKEKKEVKKE